MGLLTLKNRRIAPGVAARLVVAGGGLAFAAALGAAVTWQVGLLTAGAEAVAYGLFLMDVDGK